MESYPCPYCRAPADLASGCTGCGRPPFPEAAEVVRLNAHLVELRGEVATALRRYGEAVDRLNTAQARRDRLAVEVGRAVSAAQPAAATPPAAVPVPHRAEASTRTVQNALFILGGLLLGSAAIVFAAVAWASFGVTGRAVILAAVTLCTLAVPPLALRRGLRATAETFAALGLLLVLLDGYAAWYVNLAGLATAAAPSTYAGLVCAATAAVAAGYTVFTGLRGPRFAALVALQPALPLLAVDRGLGATGWAVVFLTVAALDVLLGRVVEPAAWVPAGLAALIAAPLAVFAVATAGGVAGAARASGALLLLGALIVVAGLAHPVTAHVGAGLAAGIAAGAGVRLAASLVPHQRYVAFAAVGLAVAAVAVALPSRVRRGARIGALVVTGVLATPFAAIALITAGWTAGRALPAWQPRGGTLVASYDWQVPAALVVLAAAFAVLVRRRTIAYPAAVLVAFTATGFGPTNLTVVSIVDGVLLLGLVAAVLWLDRAAAVALPFVALHLALVGLATPLATLATYAGLAGLSAVVSVRLREPAALVALAVLPVPFAAGGRLAFDGVTGWAHVPVPLAAAFVGLGFTAVAAAVLHGRPDPVATALYRRTGALATAIAASGVTVAAVWVSVVDGGRAPFGVFAAGSLLCVWVAARGFAVVDLRRVVPAVVPALVTAVAVVPAVLEVLVRPYRWLGAIWRGGPTGVGLDPAAWAPGQGAFGAGPAAVALGLLAALAVLVARRLETPLWTYAGPPATLAAVLGCVAVGAPWPAVPAVTLAAGLATGLLAALRPSARNVGAVTCWFTAGAGLAGCLATPAATLVALGAVVVTAAVAGVAGRATGARVAGWLVASVAAGWLAFAATRAADLPLRSAGYWMLLAAAVILAGSQVLGRRAARPSAGVEARVVESVAHAVAAVAVLLTAGHLGTTAAIVSLWGVALGLRALTATAPVPFAGCAGAAQLVAYWLLLAASGVSLVEAYTVPAAVVAVLAGWFASRRNPGLTSWMALAPGLLAGFAPSLALVSVTSGEPGRRLLLGGCAVAVVLVGAARRLQAPVVVAGGALLLLALHEIFVYWDRLPRWAPLAIAGLVLVALATTYERRLRDLARLRNVVGRMR